jgi:hypothetical protein
VIGATLISMLAALAMLVTSGPAQAATLSQAALSGLTDEYLFTDTLPQFETVKAQHPHADQLDWSDDGCSFSPETPLGFQFHQSCQRHDFGYRNYKRQDRFSEVNRKKVDDNFHHDLYNICGTNFVCRRVADIYYYAVRTFGGLGGSTAQSVDRAMHTPHAVGAMR